MAGWFALGAAQTKATDSWGESSNDSGVGGVVSRIGNPFGVGKQKSIFNWGGYTAKGKKPTDWQSRIDPELMKQLMAQAAGEGSSAAQELGNAMIDRNQRAMMSTAISGEGGNAGTAMRGAMQEGAQLGLQGQQQIMAMRAQEQKQAQDMLLEAMLQASSLDDAMAIFRANLAQRQKEQRDQALAGMVGAGAAAFAQYQGQPAGGAYQPTEQEIMGTQNTGPYTPSQPVSSDTGYDYANPGMYQNDTY